MIGADDLAFFESTVVNALYPFASVALDDLGISEQSFAFSRPIRDTLRSCRVCDASRPAITWSAVWDPLSLDVVVKVVVRGDALCFGVSRGVVVGDSAPAEFDAWLFRWLWGHGCCSASSSAR